MINNLFLWMNGYIYIEVKRPWLEPNIFVIIDNTDFYKSIKIRDLLKNTEVELLYLQKYYPYLNYVAKCWRPLKIKIPKAREFCQNFYEIMTYILCYFKCQIRLN
jgi:hypothetical protein